MVLSPEAIEGLCRRFPGLEAWILLEPAGDTRGEPRLVHFGGPADAPEAVRAARKKAEGDE